MSPAVNSLVDLLELRARQDHGRSAFTFLANDGNIAGTITYREIDFQARLIAARLMEMASAGERALLLYPPGLEFLPAFFGCLYAAIMAVPAYPPHRNRNLFRLQSIFKDAQPRFVLTTSALLPRIEAAISGFGRADVIATDQLSAGKTAEYIRPQISSNAIAFLQYTSGSTSNPKGVMITHGNLLHNAALVNEAVGPAPDDSYVSWLPVFHDMGFMAGILQPLYRGLPSVLMSPAAFLEMPVRWLHAISRYKATASGGPSFAYDLCVRRIAKDDLEGIDLSSWAIAFNGSEPVRADVMDRFASAFAQCGFQRNAFYPCYGLAEATLMVSGSRKGHSVNVCEFDKRELENHRVSRLDGEKWSHALVACGRNLSGQEIAIVDPDSHERCAPDQVGEIWVRGPSIASGYWNNHELSQETFHACIHGTDAAFLRTGDLGFLHDEQLFVTGRIKDLLIIRGQNHYPQDIELTVEACDSVFQPGSGAAFSVEAGNEERLVVVQESANPADHDWEKVFASIRRAIAGNHELAPHAIILIRTGTIPKTSSGKVQRRACKEAFTQGQLRILVSWYEQEDEGFLQNEGNPALPEEPVHTSTLARQVIREIAQKTGVAPEKIVFDQPLTSYGLDSLAAVELAHKLQVEFGLDLKMPDLFDGMSPADIVRQVEQTHLALPDLSPQASETYPLAYGQRAIWYLQDMAPHSSAYNIAKAVRITSKVDVDLLRRSFQALVDRHPALRTTFFSRQGEPFQRVQPEAKVWFESVDASSWSESRLTEALVELSQRPFDLVNGPVFAIRLYTRSANDHVLQLAAHHLIVDFWSLMVLLRDLGALYQEHDHKGSPELPILKYSYADFVSWQHRLASDAQDESLWSYWKHVFTDEIAALNLPADKPRPAVSSFCGAALEFVVDPGLAAQLKQIASGCQATLFMALLAAFEILLHRLTAQERFAVGVPTSGRARAEFADLAGYFVNVLPLTAAFTEPAPFSEFLARVRRTTLDSFAHDAYPFPLMVEKLGIPRSFNSSPVFQTMFVFHKAYATESTDLVSLALNEPGARMTVGGLECESYPLEEHTAQFDLVLTMGESKDGLRGTWQYSTDLFEPATVARWIRSFLELLRAIVAHPGRLIAELPVVPEGQHTQLLIEFNQTRLEYDRCQLLHERIAHQAILQPDRTAVTCGTERISYRDLNLRANQIAGYLRQQGIGVEDLVAICARRTPEMVAAMLGVWKAGAAYVPLDPQYPYARMRFMLEDSGAKFVLTEEALQSKVEGATAKVVSLSQLTDLTSQEFRDGSGAFAGEQLAYLIYTSGSTGTPKGVMLTHQSAVSFAAWARKTFSAEEFSGVLAATSICFDLSIFELWATLGCGGSVILAENILEWYDRQAGADEQQPVTLINTVPSAMEKLLQHRLPASVSTVNLAGEPVQEALVRKIYDIGAVKRVNNLYGPSETTTYSSWTTLTAGAPVTIGRALANTQLYVLDSALQLVPIGVVGELYIGGAGLARGYWQHADWTAERFLPNPYSTIPGERMFRTGDLVRWQADGQLLYLGRTDQQVKIRGFRIELGEISAVLGGWDAIRENAATVRDEGGDKHLVVYVVPAAHGELTAEKIRDYMQCRLPEYMVPNHIVLLPELPKTSSGKIDRKALPQPQPIPASGRMPATEPEREIALVWQELLGLEHAGAEDDFFLLGGHSLLMMQLKARLEARFNRTIPLAQLLQSPTVAGMAKAIEPLPANALLPSIIATTPEGPVELSFAQARIWFLEQMNPGLSVYNIAGAVRLRGNLNKLAVRASLKQIVQRHAVLRTSFIEVQETPHQQIHPVTNFELQETDLRSARDALSTEELLTARLQEEARRAFSLSQSGLIRALLIETEERDFTLIVVLHHIVADGWSIGVLLRELAELYGAYCEARPSSLPPLKFQFADYAVWQRKLLQTGNMNHGLAYWKRQLEGAPPVLDLPVDALRPGQPAYTGSVVQFALDEALNRRLRELCHRQAITPYVFFLGCFQALLSRYSGQTDIVVGSPVADRQDVESENLIGLFANLLPIRSQVEGEESFAFYLQQLKRIVTEAQEWRHVPFEKIVEQAGIDRNASRMPLVQAVFAWQAGLMPSVRLADIIAQPEIVHTRTSKFDLTLTVEQEKDSELIAWIEYSTEIFKEQTIRHMAARYLRLLEQAVDNPAQCIGDFSLLSESERQQIVTQWSGAAFQQKPGCVHLWFEQHAERSPQAIAVISGSRGLTYGDLNAVANQIAHVLIQRGIGPESIVAICCERSPWAIIAILAVFKAGAAYLPLDPEYPPDRLACLVDDARAAFILAEVASAEKLPARGVPALLLDGEPELWLKQSTENPENRSHESNLAYVIYTSGSTGQPKGVMVQHDNLAALLSAADRQFGFRPDDRWTLFHLYSFDFSVWEMWGALAYGGCVVIVPSSARVSVQEFYRLIQDEKITVLSQVPSAFYRLLDYEEQIVEPGPLVLRAVVFGGEALDVRKLDSWIKRHGEQTPLLVNGYGITETTIFVTYKQLGAGDIAAGRSVIGSPFPGYRTWLLDQRQMLLPPGIPGEIYVGGTGVARGYLNRPDLTAERFVPDPFGKHEGGRVYRSGDQGRYLADGTIEYLGRLDHQVKVRGYRIEPGEIESTLKSHAAIHDCVVLAKPEAAGEHRLVAYLVSAQWGTLPQAELRAFLKSKLPDYMVPTQFVFVDRWPLTPNGKIDRKQLLQLEAGLETHGVDPAILDPTEELIAGIWSSLLGVTELSSQSNFFDLGGHSLLATQVLLRLRQVFARDVPFRWLFEFPVLGELAAQIRKLAQARNVSPIVPILPASGEDKWLLSSGQERLWFLHQFAASSHAYNVAGVARLKGELDVAALRHSFQAMVRRHQILRTGFVEHEGRPGLINASTPFELETKDFRQQPDAEQKLVDELRQESTREFMLSRPPLFRAILFRLGEDDHFLVVVMHHIIADAWSIQVMIRELAAYYSSHHAGIACQLPQLPFQYADYAAWEHARWANGDLNAGLEYWRKQLAGAPRLELPADFPREAGPTYHGHMLRTILGAELSYKLKELARRENVTLFMLLLAGVQALLSQYTGEEDVVVGTSMANRNGPDTGNLIGLFTNEVVLRTRLHGDPGFHEILSRVREVTLSAYAHQDVPFGKLVEALQPERDFSRNPFFQTTVLLNDDFRSIPFGNLILEPVDSEIESAIFDLSVIFVSGADGRIRASLRHSTRFKLERMERLLQDLAAVFSFIVERPDGSLTELRQVVAAKVYREVPDSFAPPAPHLWSEITGENIPRMFEQQVLATPGNIAVSYEEVQLTFAELNEKANRVANYLLKLGIKSEDYVALCLSRSVEMMVGILGVLKSGAAYVPLDRTYPAQRLQYILKETAAAAILTEHSLAVLFAGTHCHLVRIDDGPLFESSAENPAVVIHPGNVAYAIYTSGSTGRPKGVMIQHRSVLNLLQGLEQTVYSGMSPTACVAMNAPVVFDASVKQWIRILKGNTICILPEEKRFDPEALLAYIQERNIDVLDCTPSVLRLILQHRPRQSASACPRAILIGGEAIDLPTWERLREQDQTRFYNVYGPTECTVDVSVCEISESTYPSIGHPINNVAAYVLNSRLQPLPPGETGELYVAGAGLARGYCARPDLTAESFIPDPISGVAGSRLYRTGDLARLLTDGKLEFCGRRDDQVKIRGYRVELEEIASTLRKIDGVRDAVVLMTEANSGQSRLLAYVVPEPETVPDPEQLRNELRREIPEYMMPSGFVILDQLPVTVNGKIDRKALLLMSAGQRTASSSYAPARNRMEEVVAAIWQEVLGLRKAGIHDNFFDLGGHSLAMVQVRSKVRDVLKQEVPMVELFRNPTIAMLSRYLQDGQTQNPSLQLVQSRARRRIQAAHRAGK